MFNAALETLPQGDTQQQLLSWLSIVHARKTCVKCVKVHIKIFIYVNMHIYVKVKVDIC